MHHAAKWSRPIGDAHEKACQTNENENGWYQPERIIFGRFGLREQNQQEREQEIELLFHGKGPGPR